MEILSALRVMRTLRQQRDVLMARGFAALLHGVFQFDHERWRSPTQTAATSGRVEREVPAAASASRSARRSKLRCGSSVSLGVSRLVRIYSRFAVGARVRFNVVTIINLTGVYMTIFLPS